MYIGNQKTFHVTSKQTSYDFPKPLNTVGIGRGKARYDLLELYCGFDIETTTITTPEGQHLAFAYHFQLTVGTPRQLNIYLCRTWDIVTHLFDGMAAFYGLNDKRHMIIAIANMGFEFQFMRQRFQWDSGEWDFFAKDKYKPLRATYKGIEFREVLSISGGSLAQMAKDYCTTQKLVTIDQDGVKHSDLDYKKLRNSNTPLTELEEQYCINDVVILSEFMWWLFCEYIRPEKKIPMTFTGILFGEIKNELKTICTVRDDKNHLKHGSSLAEWMSFVKTLQPKTLEEYSFYMKYLFRGGYVHANALYTDLDGLLSEMEDITSHYPGRMNLDYFPMSEFKPVEFDPDKMRVLDPKLIYSKCLIIHCQIDYIRTTTTHSVESRSKIIQYNNGRFDNGRLVSADMIEVCITEKDLQIYQRFYKWEGITILAAYQADRGKMPPYVLNVLNRHYRTKEHLKRSGKKDTPEYTVAKSRVNSAYGLTVKRLRQIRVKYDNDNGWYEDLNEFDYNKEIQKAVLSPFWGIWVTAGARFELLSIIYKLEKAGVPVYYGDTDSNKHKRSHKARQIFKHYNTSIKKHRKNRGLRSSFFDGLAEFDNEIRDEDGKPREVPFKMLGAKRYIYFDGSECHATVAGMPKASIKQIGQTPNEILRKFSRFGFRLTPEQSGKLTTEYTDEPYSADINGETMTELSGVALYEIPFSISLASDYVAHIDELQSRFNREDTYI